MVSQTSTAEKFNADEFFAECLAADTKKREDRAKLILENKRASVSEVYPFPALPQIEHCPRRIDERDEKQIRWALGNPHVSYMRHSSGEFGRQLAHAESFGYGALPCRKCGGKWRAHRMPKGKQCTDCKATLPTGVTECPRCHIVFGSGWQDGTGQAPKARMGKGGKRLGYAALLAAYRVKMQREHRIVLMSKPAPKPGSGVDREAAWQVIEEKFRAEGKRLMTDGELRALFPRLPEADCEPCKDCGGIGVVPRRAGSRAEITAFPTGNSKQIGGREAQSAETLDRHLEHGIGVVDGDVCVMLDELRDWVLVQQLLADVAELAPIARVALEEYYDGDGGHARLAKVCPGPTDGDRARQADELRDFMSQCWNLCAWGAES